MISRKVLDMSATQDKVQRYTPILACVAADSFPFSGRAEIEQEHAWGEPKNWGEVGRE